MRSCPPRSYARRVRSAHKEESAQSSAKIRPVPRKMMKTIIGLCQVWRLLRRAPSEGTYLDFLTRLAFIHTWRNARRVGYAELP
jgi:hypothetical protein